jgi:probable F420-dependent oxidoreductase
VSRRRISAELLDWYDVEGRVDFAVELERRGFAGVTVNEVTDPDAFVVLALAARATTRVTLETSVVQCGVRTVPSLAASSATIQDVSRGRFRLGFGVSSEAIVHGWHGQRWEKPLSHAREAVELLRTVLAGEKTRYEGSVLHSSGFQLAQRVQTPVPLHLAALNQHMIRLAGGTADGVWLNYLPRQAAATVVGIADAAAEEAGRPAPHKILTAHLEVTDDPAAARHQLRDYLAFYMTSPAYRKALAWHGFPEEIADIEACVEKRDRAGVTRGITDEMIDSMTLVGTPVQVRDRIEEYFDAGVDEISVALLTPANMDASLRAAVEANGAA